MRKVGPSNRALQYSIMKSDHTFLDHFDHHFNKINDELGGILKSPVHLIKDIGRHSLMGGGKRIRPLLFVLSSHVCGYEAEDVYRFSTIFEYIHTGSLLHDDVLDNADFRRKKPSARHVWGNLASVLGGDFFYLKAVGKAISLDNIELLRVLNDSTTRMVEGQFLELSHTHDWHLSRDEYLRIIISKTAVLMSAACTCGGIVAGAEKDAVDHLDGFGLNLGIAFQLIDDLLDYTSTEEEFGKPVGKDLKEGKITLPLIYALSELGNPEIDRLEELFKSDQASDDDYRELIDLVRRNGAVERIRSEAKDYVDRAARFLDLFSPSPAREDLLALNAYVVERSF